MIDNYELLDLAFKLEDAAKAYCAKFDEVKKTPRKDVVWLKNDLTGFGVAITENHYRAEQLVDFVEGLE